MAGQTLGYGWRVSDDAAALPARRFAWPRRELLLPGLLAAVAQPDVWAGPPLGLGHVVGPRPVIAALYVATSLALVWRARAPLAVLALILSAETAEYLAFGAPEGLGAFLPPLVAFYAVGRYAPAASLAVAGPLVILGTSVHELKDPVFQLSGSEVFFWVVLAAAWPLGQAFQRRAAEAARLDTRARRLVLQREQAAQAAIDAERARIARELHDIVGHGLSVVVLQLVAALGLAEKTGQQALYERLLGTERSARQTLAEMRRLLGLLDEGEAPEGPAGLGQLDRLLADTRAAGAEIEFAVSGEPVELPSGPDLALFRIVQEALTNVLKHAHPPNTRVHLRYGLASVTVEVTDQGRGAAGGPSPSGRGLAGIRERVALYGGELDLGPQPHGGFLVRACLPLEQ